MDQINDADERMARSDVRDHFDAGLPKRALAA